MNMRIVAVCVVALLAVAGCRVDPRIVRLEEENRLLGDRIYELEDLVNQYEYYAQTDQPSTAATAATQPSGSPVPNVQRPPARQAAPAVQHPGTLDTPRVEFPTEATPEGQIPARLQPGGGNPPTETAPGTGPPLNPPEKATAPKGAWRVGASDRQVVSITLNGAFTGGYNADDQPGDEGITASIEPRDAEGRLVAAAAPVSVVVLDPAEKGAAARVARWEFSAEEIAAMAESTRMSEGIHLAMLWPDQPPTHGQLRLFVRYSTSDGRKLQVDQSLEVDLPGRQARRWKSPAPGVRSAASPPAAAPETRVAQPAAPPTAEPTPVRVATRPSPPPADSSPPRRKAPAWSPTR